MTNQTRLGHVRVIVSSLRIQQFPVHKHQPVAIHKMLPYNLDNLRVDNNTNTDRTEYCQYCKPPVADNSLHNPLLPDRSQ